MNYHFSIDLSLITNLAIPKVNSSKMESPNDNNSKCSPKQQVLTTPKVMQPKTAGPYHTQSKYTSRWTVLVTLNANMDQMRFKTFNVVIDHAITHLTALQLSLWNTSDKDCNFLTMVHK